MNISFMVIEYVLCRVCVCVCKKFLKQEGEKETCVRGDVVVKCVYVMGITGMVQQEGW